MKLLSNQALFIFITVATVFLLYMLSPILTPFVLAGLLAYLTNPLVSKLDKRLPHLVSVLCIFLILFAFLGLLVLILIPLIQKQINALIEVMPQILSFFQVSLIPRLKEFIQVDTFKDTLSAAIPKSGWVLTTIWHSGYTLILWTVNLVLIPVVTFYLLRDWNLILQNTKKNLPSSIKSTVIKLVKECDEVLGAFFRGQLLVMLSLCFIYGIGLTLVGLKIGLVIGIVGGLLSIVPFLGSTFVVVVASITSFVQFGTWSSLLSVLIVYIIGQIIEGYILTPYLVGQRIGLHPVAVIFAVMAGGTLFGFFGILLALPVAAIIVVLLRFIHTAWD